MGEDRPRRRAADERGTPLDRAFATALRAGDPNSAQQAVTSAVEAGMSVASVQARVITPAMRWIGDCWQGGTATVADEHLATAISQEVLARLFRRALQAEPRSRERVMLAAVQGEQHVLGLRMAADLLEGAGFDVLYLGADMPLAGLLAACRKHAPAALGLSVSMPLNVPALISEIRAVCGLERPPAIFVGGRAVAPAIAQGLNVPIIETVEDTVPVVEGLLAEPRRKVVPDELAARVPDIATQHGVGTEDPGTAERFSRTVAWGAESARDATRHAFAMEQLAYRDPLTNLWNRRAYDDRFHELGDEPAAMILTIDVDRFKSINDSYGHEVGDATLVAVGKAMLRSVRPEDFVARYGGDEFYVLLPGAGPEEALAIAERIRDRVEQVSDPPATVSVGVSPARESIRGTSLAADRALYDAKETGRNRVVVAG